MRTADEILNDNGCEGNFRFHNSNLEERDREDIIYVINEAREEAIRECAAKAQNILALINELK